MSANARTTRAHWDEAWVSPPRWKLPSGLVVGTRNLQRVLRQHVRPGMRFLEIGCAPGKMLAWVAASLQANVAGLDYSEQGIAWSRRLFEELNIPVDLRCENAVQTTFEPASFDVVFSAGLIEHFDDPSEMVRAHVRLVRPGGRAIITVPNYGALYGGLQRRFDPANLAIHNTAIMTPQALVDLAPADLTAAVSAYRAGSLSPWLISFDRRLPRVLAAGVAWALNGLGLLQPFDIQPLCPMLVLEIQRGEAAC